MLPQFEPTVFFEWIPKIAIASLAVIILLALWMVWRNIAPAAPGISLGYYEVIGKYAGRKLLKRIKGTLVDATALFINPEIEREFKQMIIEDMDALLKRDRGNPENAELEKIRDEFADCSLSDKLRVIVTRERLFTKHVLIQYGHVDKPLNAYAVNEPAGKFTLSMGFLSQGVITGTIHTFPQPWHIYKLGRVHVHLFCPDAPANEPNKQPPEWMAKIALFAPASVELKDLLKSKDEQLREKDRKLSEMGQELSAMATERDALRRTLQGFMTTGDLPETVTPKKLDIMDFATLTVPTIVGYFIAEQTQTQPIIGVILGLLVGVYFVFRRR